MSTEFISAKNSKTRKSVASSFELFANPNGRDQQTLTAGRPRLETWHRRSVGQHYQSAWNQASDVIKQSRIQKDDNSVTSDASTPCDNNRHHDCEKLTPELILKKYTLPTALRRDYRSESEIDSGSQFRHPFRSPPQSHASTVINSPNSPQVYSNRSFRRHFSNTGSNNGWEFGFDFDVTGFQTYDKNVRVVCVTSPSPGVCQLPPTVESRAGNSRSGSEDVVTGVVGFRGILSKKKSLQGRKGKLRLIAKRIREFILRRKPSF